MVLASGLRGCWFKPQPGLWDVEAGVILNPPGAEQEKNVLMEPNVKENDGLSVSTAFKPRLFVSITTFFSCPNPWERAAAQNYSPLVYTLHPILSTPCSTSQTIHALILESCLRFEPATSQLSSKLLSSCVLFSLGFNATPAHKIKSSFLCNSVYLKYSGTSHTRH